MNIECMNHVCIATYACDAFLECYIVFDLKKIQLPKKCMTFIQFVQNQVYMGTKM